MTTAMVVPETRSIATMHELGVEDVIAQVTKIQSVMAKVMKDGEHYGLIPGTGTKPSLLKAGAEKLCLLFRLDPQYEVVEVRDGAHLTVQSRCTLWHIPTGQRMGSGMGSCSTKESKYAYRQGKRACPKCGQETINRSKYPPRNQPNAEPGWYCHQKAGGCGAEFAAKDGAITDQATGRVPNPDLADQYNTVLKMANKRSLVAAVLNVTAASDIFTQDLEDYPVVETVRVVETKPEPERVEPEPEGEPMRATNGQDWAPINDWVEAMRKAQTLKALQHLWKGVTAPDLWETWSEEGQAQLTAEKDAAKARLSA